MRRPVLLVLVVLALWGLLHWITRGTGQTTPPGVLVTDAPRQDPISGPLQRIRVGKFILTARATYRMRARVLSREDYSLDAGAALAPVDLAVGWQRMSDSAVLKHIRIRQHGRFYFWSTAKYPIPRRQIETESANMHIIPANEEVRRTLDKVHAGQVIGLSGELVDANGPGGMTWRTSLTRNDTGGGACELFYVQSLTLQ
jgi:hypothetical protein